MLQENLSKGFMQENLSKGFMTRSDTNQGVQPQKIARGLKVWIYEVEGLYYLCSKNKGADQLHTRRAADLRHYFHICKKTTDLLMLRLNCTCPKDLYRTRQSQCIGLS